MRRFVLEQMGDFARAGEAIEGPSHFSSWPITSVSQFGPRPPLAEPDMTARVPRPLLDHFVGGGQKCFGDGKTKRFRRFEIDPPPLDVRNLTPNRSCVVANQEGQRSRRYRQFVDVGQ